MPMTEEIVPKFQGCQQRIELDKAEGDPHSSIHSVLWIILILPPPILPKYSGHK